MKFLLKYPSRERPELFAKTIEAWSKSVSGKHELIWFVSLDENDPTLAEYRSKCDQFDIDPIVGKSKNKIDAVNRDMDRAPDEWDVLVLVSDDMRPTAKNWDAIIADQMPTLDMGLWFPDGRRRDLCTLSIIGRSALIRLGGFLYHPAFESVWCDDFYHLQMQTWGILKFVDRNVFKHEWRVHNNDALMKRNEDGATASRDKKTFERLSKQFTDEFTKGAA